MENTKSGNNSIVKNRSKSRSSSLHRVAKEKLPSMDNSTRLNVEENRNPEKFVAKPVDSVLPPQSILPPTEERTQDQSASKQNYLSNTVMINATKSDVNVSAIPPSQANLYEKYDEKDTASSRNMTETASPTVTDKEEKIDVNVISVLSVVKELSHKVGALGVAIPHLLHQAQDNEKDGINPLDSLKPEDNSLFEMILVKFSSITNAPTTSFVEKIIVSEAASQLQLLIKAINRPKKFDKCDIVEWADVTVHMNTNDTLLFLKKKVKETGCTESLPSLYMALKEEQKKLINTDVEDKIRFFLPTVTEANTTVKGVNKVAKPVIQHEKQQQQQKHPSNSKVHPAFTLSDEDDDAETSVQKDVPMTNAFSRVPTIGSGKPNLIAELHSQLRSLQQEQIAVTTVPKSAEITVKSGLDLIQQHYVQEPLISMNKETSSVPRHKFSKLPPASKSRNEQNISRQLNESTVSRYQKEAAQTIRYPQVATQSRYQQGAAQTSHRQGTSQTSHGQGTSQTSYPQGSSQTGYAQGATHNRYQQGATSTSYPQVVTQSRYQQGASSTSYPQIPTNVSTAVAPPYSRYTAPKQLPNTAHFNLTGQQKITPQPSADKLRFTIRNPGQMAWTSASEALADLSDN